MKKVGTITIEKGVNDRYRSQFETASWYEEIILKPGQYDVLLDEYSSPGRPYYRTSIPGVIESDYFQSSFCGNPIGQSYDTKQNAGKPKTVHTGECPQDAYWFPIWCNRWKFEAAEAVA